jgi:NitT/TauT family transport system permease protein
MKSGAPYALASFALVVLAAAAAWQALSAIIGAHTLPGPLETARRLGAALIQPSFLADLAATAQAYVVALIVAMAAGTFLGLLCGAWRAAGQTLEPVLNVVVAIPKVTLYPVILLLFGLGDAAKVAFGILHGLPTVAIITAGALRSLKPIYRKAAMSLRLSRRHYALYVLLPAVTPEIVASFRICFALTLLGVLVGEMFASTHGLGHLLMASIGVDDMPTVMAIILLMFVFAGAGSSALLALVGRMKG